MSTSSPSSSQTATPLDAAALRLRWVMRLRWAGVAAQLLIVFASGTLAHEDFTRALAVVGVGVLSNAAVQLWLRRRFATTGDVGPAAVVVGVVILVDVALLTVLLAFTGGPLNPYTLFYVVHVATATVALPRRWSWSVAVVAAGGYGVLFLPGVFDMDAHMHLMHGPGFFAHVRGMWIAFSITAAFIVLFLGQLRHALEEREQRLQDMRDARARELRLASLATLAGGAAHELATPLSSIALVAESLQRDLPANASTTTRDDVVLLAREVARCISVLRQLSADAGSPNGEHPERVTVSTLAGRTWDDENRKRLDLHVDVDVADLEVLIPPRAIITALRGLVKNGLQASGDDAVVAVQCSRQGPSVVVRIADRGHGLDPATRARIGEPFFTTKGPGDGMGLGVFLAKTVVEQSGGSLSYEDRPGGGTCAVVRFPIVSRRIDTKVMAHV